MKILDDLFARPQYTLTNKEKSSLLVRELTNLQALHIHQCELYHRILGDIWKPEPIVELAELPFLPVRLFKNLDLKSIPDQKVLNVLTSSGTSSQLVARIAVDRETSMLQTKALVSIVTSFIGPKRLPMIIMDSRATVKNRTSLSARGAGLVGMSNFGRDHFYALDEEMQLDLPGLKAFAEKYKETPVLIFGFTFMLWQYLISELQRLGETLSLDQAILIHGGGWKKLEEQAVSNDIFKAAFKELCNITRVHNFYGMVEQVGSIYMECEHGHLHAPNFADILIRDYRDWSILPIGSIGVVETLSVLPRSYPGHALLTEDLGIVHGIDNCPCGRLGTTFSIEGRIPQAELRGCSDTHAYNLPKDSKAIGDITAFLPIHRTNARLEDLVDDDFLNLRTLPAFDNRTVEFLGAISQAIFAIPDCKAYPELVSLAYWLRKANITSYVRNFLKQVGEYELVVPRGTTFHVAPSNVDTIFLYSWALSLLAGNRNIIRLPQVIPLQLKLVLNAVRGLLVDNQWDDIAVRNIVLSYPREDEINHFISAKADIRMIWGGDETVLYFRGLPSKSSTQDIMFTDKVSFSLVNAERYFGMSEEERTEAARLFFNDSYQFDQLACSSPRLVYFMGESAQRDDASKLFWKALAGEIDKKIYHSSAADSVNKLVFGYETLANGVAGEFPYGTPTAQLGIMRITLAEANLCRTSCGGGFFFECFINDISELIPLIKENDQTLTYLGFSRNEMREIGASLCTKGLRRIVPVGQALSFSPLWDGYVLFNELTQRVPIM